MVEKEIAITTADGLVTGFLYQPAPSGRWPGVIFLTDILGIRDANQQMAKRMASKGYVVLLPNVFYRTDKPPLFDATPDFVADENSKKRFNELSEPLTPDAMERDGSSYVDFLDSQDSVAGGMLGVVGYCFTGAMALRIAAARPDKIAIATSLHGGRLYTDSPTSPHTVLSRVKSQLYFGHAIEDRGMPKEAIEKLEDALTRWGGKFESETYADARHGWTVPGGRAYNHPQAERAFEKAMESFDSTLKQQTTR